MKERPVWDLWSTTAGSELWTWGREDCWENYSVLQRGVFGENVVMYAFLLRQFGRAMGLLDWMKENRSTLVGKPYPQIILLPYQLRNSAATKEQSLRGIPSKWNFSFYEGETLLHIAVVNSAYDHVKKLLEDHLDKAIEEKLLTKQDKYDFIHRRAIGSFFDKIENPVCYYGMWLITTSPELCPAARPRRMFRNRAVFSTC